MFNKILTTVNLIIVTIIFVMFMKTKPQGVAAQERQQTIRTQRIEIIDSHGHVTASLGFDETLQTPKLIFYNEKGQDPFLLMMDSHGNPSMSFRNENTDPNVTVGYIWGSDVMYGPKEKDPLGTWGIKVEASGGVKSLDSFDIDPDAQKRLKDDLKDFSIPPTIPVK